MAEWIFLHHCTLGYVEIGKHIQSDNPGTKYSTNQYLSLINGGSDLCNITQIKVTQLMWSAAPMLSWIDNYHLFCQNIQTTHYFRYIQNIVTGELAYPHKCLCYLQLFRLFLLKNITKSAKLGISRIVSCICFPFCKL